MKWQLVASVIVTGTPIGKKPKYPITRQAVFHVKLGPSSDGAPDHILRCACGRVMVYDPAQVEWNKTGCYHIEKLYKNQLDGVTLTELGRDLFYWRYTVQALSR